MSRKVTQKKQSPRYVYTGHEEFPKTNIKLTHQELEILFKHPAKLMKTYMFLSLYRDFNTNIVGEAVHIDDLSFKLWIGYAARQGRKAWKPSTTHISRWLMQLEDLGLIKSLGNNVFYLPLAPTLQDDQKISHQTVTKVSPNNARSVTNQDTLKTPVNTAENPTSNIQVSPNNNGGVTELSQRLCTIPDRLDLMRSDPARENFERDFNDFTTPAGKFRKLLIDRGYERRHLTHAKTCAMIHSWVKENVTVEEVLVAMNHADTQLDQTPVVPWYYLPVVFQYREDLKNAHQTAQEIKAHAKPTTNKPAKSQYLSMGQRVQAKLNSLPDEWPEEEDEL